MSLEAPHCNDSDDSASSPARVPQLRLVCAGDPSQSPRIEPKYNFPQEGVDTEHSQLTKSPALSLQARHTVRERSCGRRFLNMHQVEF
mmetsp:Transcript_707/g.1005  ORF Transcript_707/g.1005 Transcript_707/m.1005 type:complete len:88 (-) Transcript_707:325-588(-)